MSQAPQKLITMFAGSRWENTRGTDHRLAEALSRRTPVLWVDPPVPIAGPASSGRPPLWPGYALDGIKPGLLRLRVAVPPGFTRPVLRGIANKLVGRAVRATLEGLPMEPCATVVLSPRESFPSGVAGMRLLHVTDDWVAGAAMMGLSRQRVAATLQENIDAAHVICIVSPSLDQLISDRRPGCSPVVLPNGCSTSNHDGPGERKRRAAVALVGQLNERLDFDLLDKLVDSGLKIEVIGPRRDRSVAAGARLDSFLQDERVTWLGEVTEDEAFARMRELAVGITPYVDNAFNRASFPIKTLDYLAAGLQVVSTDLPAARWLDSEWVDIADSSSDFVSRVRHAVQAASSQEDIAARRSFAAGHSWDARAKQLLALIDEGAA
ncbi:MAG: glycosyltransferase [Specibacter sp.]